MGNMRHKDIGKTIQGKMTMIRKIFMSKSQGQTQELKVKVKRNQTRSLIWTDTEPYFKGERFRVF